jgi:hypothetical protein
MTVNLAVPTPSHDNRFTRFFSNAFEGSRNLSIHAALMVLGFVMCWALQAVDTRQFNGIDVWIKPGKFFLSLAVQLLTVAWAISLVEKNHRANRTIQWATWALIGAAWLELAYITFRAARGEASHYNIGTALNAALYSAMGVLSVVLVAAPAMIGWKIWRLKPNDIWTESIALGFVLAAITTLIVGFTLAANPGHWIGGDLTDATGLPIFKWSTTGGDLRVAHFMGLHAMQIIPFAAVSGKRSVVIATSIAITVITALTYMQALNGIPFLKP